MNIFSSLTKLLATPSQPDPRQTQVKQVGVMEEAPVHGHLLGDVVSIVPFLSRRKRKDFMACRICRGQDSPMVKILMLW